MKSIFFGFVMVSLMATAQHKKHREHKAHKHGDAELSIAFDSLIGQLEFKTPAESIVGFEHQPKSDKDKQKLTAAKVDFETNISKYIQFDSSLACKFEKKSITLAVNPSDDHHADFVARFDITCLKPIQGTTIAFDFTTVSKLKRIHTTVLAGELQLKTDIRAKKTTLDIK